MGERAVVGIIGAGAAGLTAASALRSHAHVIILDKGRVAGGRLCTKVDRELKEKRWDKGAMFFTIRSPDFRSLVDPWLSSGQVKLWTNGFGKEEDGHPRYRGTDGMNSIAQALLSDLLPHPHVQLRTGTKVVGVRHSEEERKWIIDIEGAQHIKTDAVIMTPPAPQTLQLLADCPEVPDVFRQHLSAIKFEPTLSVQAELSGPSLVGGAGGLAKPFPDVHFVCDNQLKGISQWPTVTIHADIDYSIRNLDVDAEQVCSDLLWRCRDVIPNDLVVSTQLHRWRYAIPSVVHPERYMLSHTPAPIAFAGDAFMHARVEGACLSGLAAAHALLPLLR